MKSPSVDGCTIRPYHCWEGHPFLYGVSLNSKNASAKVAIFLELTKLYTEMFGTTGYFHMTTRDMGMKKGSHA